MIVQTRPQLGQLAGLGEGATDSKLFYFPSDIAAAVEQTEGELRTLSGDVDRALADGRIDYDTLAAFNEFYNEWRAFADDLSWWAKMAGSTVSQCQVFRQRAAKWQQVLSAAGAQMAGQPITNLPSDKPSPWASSLRWVAIAAVVAAGAYGVSHVVGMVKPLIPARANPRRKRRRHRR
jgi:hypothetical protein